MFYSLLLPSGRVSEAGLWNWSWGQQAHFSLSDTFAFGSECSVDMRKKGGGSTLRFSQHARPGVAPSPYGPGQG